MDLKHYEQIIALAEKGSFSKASEAVHISQPALTKSIQNVEDFFQVKLFDRTPRGVVPTPYGEIVVSQARMLLKDADAISKNIKTLARLEGGIIKCGTDSTNVLMGEVIGRFMTNYPRIRVELRINLGGPQLLKMLTEKEIDFFLSGYNSELKKIETVQIIDLPEEDVIWFCRPKHPLLKIKKLTAANVAAFPLFTPIIGKKYSDWLLQVFEGTSAVGNDGKVVISFQCSDINILKRAVADSDGVSGLFASSLSDEFQIGKLARLNFCPPSPNHTTGIVYFKYPILQPAAEHLIQMIKVEYLKRTIISTSRI